MRSLGLIKRCDQVELWLRAERQAMSAPDALTAVLADRKAMYAELSKPPEDSSNKAVAKSDSHISTCALLIGQAAAATTIEDRDRLLGTLSSRALKVASGYQMKAGYFIALDNDLLYQATMIDLINDQGHNLPTLGKDVYDLAIGDRETLPSDLMSMGKLVRAASLSAARANGELYGLTRTRRIGAEAFQSWGDGSTEYYEHALRVGYQTKKGFAQLALGALYLQQDGFDGFGAIILEPLPDADANQFLRVDGIRLEGDPPVATSGYRVDR